MENIALATLLIPFAGALITSILPNRMAKWLCTLFALLATLGTVVLGWQFLAEGKVDTTITLVQYGDVALFGFTIDRVSTLIAFAVVFLGLLVSFYSTGYLTNGNREHPHDGTRRYYAFLLIFIGAMAGLVLSSTILGQLLFFRNYRWLFLGINWLLPIREVIAFGNEGIVNYSCCVNRSVSCSSNLVCKYGFV
ncbi:hydrogenase 4 subunit D [Proteus mirabilis]|uniref:Hydrogenase 4 subunit D n=1 Tax=Proteus mirabilis TaxID=584 RepID=A0A2X2CDB1_PROMI|nr:hydrogenase 4 subunit D [Proteus mirabilis]